MDNDLIEPILINNICDCYILETLIKVGFTSHQLLHMECSDKHRVGTITLENIPLHIPYQSFCLV